MAAASAPLYNNTRDGRVINRPVAASVTIYAGTMVAMDTSGNARPARATSTDKVLGYATKTVDNSSGSAGDKTIDVDTGIVARYANSTSSDAIAATDIGATCYVVFDNQVAKTSDSSARPAAGRVFDVDSTGVWVRFVV